MTDEMVTLKAPEVRTFPALEFREFERSASGRFLEGRAVPYNRWADIGWFRERFAPGAFAKSIREAARKLPLLLWHDNRTFPIGVSDEWRDNDKGLDCVWDLDVDDPRAVEAARKAERGELTGLSIGFAPIENRGKNARGEVVDLNNVLEIDDMGLMSVTRKEARLLEVSLTPTPAYAGAQVSLVRSQAPQEQGVRRRSAEVEAWQAYLASVRGDR
ncbi:MAG: HK97 family phage prohead protease [Propionibacteriaceae bacterium]|nr:HK97 family phage prohead protease [Propionibacteriaceae bacterium]